MPMILLLDVGNSRLKWALRQEGVQITAGSLACTDTDLPMKLHSRWRQLPKVDSVWISNVAGERLDAILSKVGVQCLECPMQFLRSGPVLGSITNRYQNPLTLGVDRLLAMYAAYERYKSATLVVDSGTAVTL